MNNHATPFRPAHPRPRIGAFARAGIVLAITFGLAACGPDGVTPPVVPPGDLSITPGLQPSTGSHLTPIVATGSNIDANISVTVGDQAATNVAVFNAENQLITEGRTGTTVRFHAPATLSDGVTYNVTFSQDDDDPVVLEDAFTYVAPAVTAPGDAVVWFNAAHPDIGTQTIDTVEWPVDVSWVVNPTITSSTYENLELDIQGTDADILYQTERNAAPAGGGVLTYEIPLDDGTYVVRLHFAEIFFGLPGSPAGSGAGSRVFHVDIDGTRVQTSYDIYAAAGGPSIAVTVEHEVTVTGGLMTIEFISVTDRAKVSAVEILAPANDD